MAERTTETGDERRGVRDLTMTFFPELTDRDVKGAETWESLLRGSENIPLSGAAQVTREALKRAFSAALAMHAITNGKERPPASSKDLIRLLEEVDRAPVIPGYETNIEAFKRALEIGIREAVKREKSEDEMRLIQGFTNAVKNLKKRLQETGLSNEPAITSLLAVLDTEVRFLEETTDDDRTSKVQAFFPSEKRENWGETRKIKIIGQHFGTTFQALEERDPGKAELLFHILFNEIDENTKGMRRNWLLFGTPGVLLPFCQTISKMLSEEGTRKGREYEKAREVA